MGNQELNQAPRITWRLLEDVSIPAPESLEEVYTDELKDLWSANDQMTKAITTSSGEVHHKKLMELFEGSYIGTDKHTAAFRSLLTGHPRALREVESLPPGQSLIRKPSARRSSLSKTPSFWRYRRVAREGIPGHSGDWR